MSLSRPAAGHSRPAAGSARQDGSGRRVADIQRARILSALVQAVADVGVSGLSVAQIVSRAGVSRRTFYELFADCEDCLLAALDHGLERIAARVAPAYQAPGRWQDRIRAGLCALLELLDEDQALARLVFVEALAAGPRALERRARALTFAIAAVEKGREAGRALSDLPPLTGEMAVGAVCSVIHTRLLEPRPAPLVRLASPLMSVIVLPYLGPAATRTELRRPAPRARSRSSAPGSDGDLLKGLGLRLTYRTTRVLAAIAEQPGASNRGVGEHAGIGDQGQVSKLLRRLERTGLIENAVAAAERGGPNAWRLTARGQAVARVIG